jgi:hypothetical protein
MALADVFTPDAFGVYTLTEAINLAPVRHRRLGEMGLFEMEPVSTPNIMVEEMHETLQLLPTVPRGGPATKGSPDKRKVRSFAIPHIPHEDVIRPDEVSVRAFGSDSSIDAVNSVVNRKLIAMRNRHEATWEYHRIGALQGRILDSDGATTIYNLFDAFDITQESTDFDLGTAGTDQVAKIITVKEAIEAALGDGVVYDHIHCIAGSTWFKSFIAHATVKAAYANWRENEYLRMDKRQGFELGGVIFEQYGTAQTSGVTYMPATQARFFPVGVPGLFMHYTGPADFMESVGRLGEPLYAKQKVMDYDRGVELHTQSNPLMMCTQPRVLHKAITST